MILTILSRFKLSGILQAMGFAKCAEIVGLLCPSNRFSFVAELVEGARERR